MRRTPRRTLPGFCFGIAGLLLLASAASAQWVRLQRCRHALPCSAPMSVRYAPDPLIAAHYGESSPTGVSAKVSLERNPRITVDTLKLSRDPSEEAARQFLVRHPPPASRRPPAATPTPAAPPR